MCIRDSYEYVVRKERRLRKLVPAVHNLVFVRSTRERMDEIKNEPGMKDVYKRQAVKRSNSAFTAASARSVSECRSKKQLVHHKAVSYTHLPTRAYGWYADGAAGGGRR